MTSPAFGRSGSKTCPMLSISTVVPVESLAAQLWIGACVRGPAPYGDAPLFDGQSGGRKVIERRRVDHHRGVHTLEGARQDQIDLAAAGLLRGRTQHGHPEACCLGDGEQGKSGPHRRGGDDVVAAGVPDSGKGVVLSADDQVGAALAGAGGERGREPVRLSFDLEATGLESVRAEGGGLVFLVRELRRVVDLVGNGDQVRRQLIDSFHHPLLEARHCPSLRSRRSSSPRSDTYSARSDSCFPSIHP
ncbi:MAG: hypothetical protein ABJA86_05250 [Nocardioidaceae bacterium]